MKCGRLILEQRHETKQKLKFGQGLVLSNKVTLRCAGPAKVGTMDLGLEGIYEMR